MRKQLFVGLFVIMLGVLPLDFPQIYAYQGLADILTKVALVVPLLVFVYWFYRWVGWYYTLYIVTDDRLVEIRQKGFFDRTVQEWQLDKIYNVNYHINGFQAAIFGYGDITVQTALGDFGMATIHKPTEIHRQLLDAVRRHGGVKNTPFDN